MGKMMLRCLRPKFGGPDIAPSCYVLDAFDGPEIKWRFVIDCGTAFSRSGGVEQLIIPDLSLFQDGRPIDAVFLTHAHDDHMGALPSLVPFLAEGAKFFMTRPTAAFVKHVFMHEFRSRRQIGAPKPYVKAQIREVLERIVEIVRPGEQELLPGVSVWVQPAGHISGACSYTFLMGGRRVHYAGDRCDHDQPGVSGALPLPAAWKPHYVAASDCTYGSTMGAETTWPTERDRLVQTCREAVAGGRTVFIYTFARHRAGVVAHELQRLGLADRYPVYLDGSAQDFAHMFGDSRHSWCERDQPFVIDRIRSISSQDDREDVEALTGGKIIIGTPGMGGPGGVGTWWRGRLLPDPEAVVAFTGYLAPGTDGDLLLKAEAKRRQTGQPGYVTFQETDWEGEQRLVSLELACRIERFRLGGHNGRRKTIRALQALRPELAVLSHGSTQALVSMEKALIGSGIGTIIRSDEQPEVEVDF